MKEEVSLNIDIVNRIHDLLKEKNMTQRQLASLLGKKESEVSRWLTGSHGFTISTIAKISAVLEESIIEVPKRKVPNYCIVPCINTVAYADVGDDIYVVGNNDFYRMNYNN